MADTILWPTLDGVAFAICAEEQFPKSLVDIQAAFETGKERYRRQAQAAICALQEPSKAMLKAGRKHGALQRAYEAMIQVLLK